jgi:hypothetical protein
VKNITPHIFNTYLRHNGSLEAYLNEINDMCWKFEYTAKGSIIYQDSVALVNIMKYFMVQVKITFDNQKRYWKFDMIQELTFEEYVDMVSEEEDVKSAYYKLLMYLR